MPCGRTEAACLDIAVRLNDPTFCTETHEVSTMPSTMHTVSERARKRAKESKLRAFHQTAPDGTRYYVVYNLSSTPRRKYVVQLRDGKWVCHCEAAKAQARCKHVQRVLDREEARTKQDALAELDRETQQTREANEDAH